MISRFIQNCRGESHGRPYFCYFCSTGCLLRQQIFRKTSKLSYYFYIVNNCVHYVHGELAVTFNEQTWPILKNLA
jgi:hypothetical protein